MKLFKKTKAAKDAKIAETVKSILTKFKLDEKIAQANQWADAHKKRVLVITILALLASLIIGIAQIFISGHKESDMFGTMADVQPTFDGMRRIQHLKTLQLNQTIEMTNRGQRLKHELDSLVALPAKTRKDSVDIKVKYKQLEIVVNCLNNKQKE